MTLISLCITFSLVTIVALCSYNRWNSVHLHCSKSTQNHFLLCSLTNSKLSMVFSAVLLNFYLTLSFIYKGSMLMTFSYLVYKIRSLKLLLSSAKSTFSFSFKIVCSSISIDFLMKEWNSTTWLK